MIYQIKKRREFLLFLANALAVIGGGFILWGLKNFFSYAPHTGNSPIGPYSLFKKNAVYHNKQKRIFIVHDNAGLYAMSDTCTHRSCMLREEVSGIICTCHDSRFDLAGTPVSGPADKPLDHYFIGKNSEKQLVVDVNQIVNSDFRYSE